ncbi:MAG: DUF58 domain-containing protein [Armatimonadota bacterium]|jgi:uncharacterized protein (DUF58 family)
MTTARLTVILIAVLSLAYLLRVGFFSFAVYVLLGLVAVSQLMGRFSLVGIRQERHCDVVKARIGETVTVRTQVTNDKALPVLWVLMEDHVPSGLPCRGERGRAMFMRPFQDHRLTYDVTLSRRGYHRLGPLVLESGDAFGLLRRFRAGRTAHYVTVYPKVVPIARYELMTRRPIGEVRVRQRMYEDPTRLAGVREYARGDPLNRIHWKATAKTRRLYSRVYDHSTMIGANIVVDFDERVWAGDDCLPRSELAITAAASIANYIAEQKQLVGLISNGADAARRTREEMEELQTTSRRRLERILAERDRSEALRPVEVPPKKAGANLLQVFETLARLELQPQLSLAQMLLAEYNRLPRDAALVLIVPQVPPALAQTIARLKTAGFVVSVFVVLNEEEYVMTRARLAQEGVRVFHLQSEADLSVLAVETI